MTDSSSLTTSKRFETPVFDSLVPKRQKLVIAYCKLLDKTQAAEEAGYTNADGQFKRTVNNLFTMPAIVEAIDEYLAAKLEQLDSGKAAVCQRLLDQSLATIYDVTQRVPYVNGNGIEIAGKYSLVPKEEDKVELRFRPAMSLIVRNTDGTYGWDNMAQHRATTMLSKLMMWDQVILDQAAPLVFNFGGIQQTPYVAPDSGPDTSSIDKSSDEIDQLTH